MNARDVLKVSKRPAKKGYNMDTGDLQGSSQSQAHATHVGNKTQGSGRQTHRSVQGSSPRKLNNAPDPMNISPRSPLVVKDEPMRPIRGRAMKQMMMKKSYPKFEEKKKLV